MRWVRRFSLGTTAVKRKLLIAGAIIGVAAASFGGVAYAATGSATPAASGHSHAAKSYAAKRHLGRARLPGLVSRVVRLAEHSIHIDAVVHLKTGFVTVAIDRGVVSSVSTSSISLKEADGQTVTDKVTTSTHVLPRATGGISGVRDGEHVVVVSESGLARLVWVPGARLVRLRGVVTSVSSSSITVKNIKGKTHSEVVTPATRVLPRTTGGIAGIHDGERVAIVESAGTARLVRVLKQPAPSSRG